MADVNELLARLKMPLAPGTTGARDPSRSPSAPNPTQLQSAAGYSQSPASPPVPGEGHGQTSSAFAFNGSAGLNMHSNNRATSDRSKNLLNLLKFNRPAGSPSFAGPELPGPSDSAQTHISSTSALPTSPPNKGGASLASQSSQESPLLKLLNRSRSPNIPATESISHSVAPQAGANTTKENTMPATDQESGGTKNPIRFTYVNPFDQLSASSPINKKNSQSVEALTHSTDIPQDAYKSSSSPAPSPLPDGRTRVEALIGIGANAQSSETVSQALDQIGPQVERDASEAVARAELEEKSDLGTIAKVVSEMEHTNLEDARQAVEEVAFELEEDLKDPDNRRTLEKIMPEPAVTAFEGKISSIAREADTNKAETDRTVRAVVAEPQIFQFPMRPFVAIDISPTPEPTATIQDDLFIKIASLKREFDQVDRTLASATTNFIVYAMLNAKGGGFRVIRQDEGTSKHVFKKAGNSIFNVSISASKNQGPEPVLATDVNGSVYWTSLPISDADGFAQEELEARGLIFPPLPSQEDNTSGAQLKTRAKLSSRHPEFFAVGRGKSIHIIWPEVALNTDAPYIDSTSRVVDSAKYLSEQCFKIGTGKAGKDFTFSEDDTLIASLDKAGRLKFWDIRSHIEAKNSQYKSRTYRHVEAKAPLLTLPTCHPTDKSWATSVQFIDKERPITKGSALRYMIIGSKQNHTLHLWDLGLGKPVQEVNFPHENELDAICSVVYHAKSGVLVVGHPTRNSIYFIHISIPRYNLSSSLSQAEFIRRLADKDSTLAKPESTSIMSGMREVSLASIGQLRSLEINPIPLAATSDEDSLLELYIMHSKGVACLNLTRQTVGIGRDGKAVYPVEGIAAGRISLSEFKSPPKAEDVPPSESSSKHEEASTSKHEETLSREQNREQNREPNVSLPSPLAKPKPIMSPKPYTGVSAAPSKKDPQLAEPDSQSLVDQKFVSFAQKAQGGTKTSMASPPESREIKPTANLETLVKPPVSVEDVSSVSMIDPRGEDFSASLGRSISSAISNTLSDILAKVLGEQLENLYRRFDGDKRVQEAAGSAKQEALLRLVSSTLTENVEESLTRIIRTNIQDFVVPSITNVTAAALDRKVSDAITEQLQLTVPREMKSALEPALSRAMLDPESLRSISESISSKITTQVEQVVSLNIQNSVTPAFKKLGAEAAQNIIADVQIRIGQQLEQFGTHRQQDAAKIDQLTALTGELLDTVKTMAQSQSAFEDKIANLQMQIAQSTQATAELLRSPPAAPAPPQRDTEVDEIATLMRTGQNEAGTIKWLQSARQAELFDKFFVQLDPAYLRQCNQIVILSVSAAVTQSLHAHILERLSWLEVAMSSIDPKDPEVVDHAPGVMDHLTQRLQEVYMQIAEETPSNPILAKIHALARQAKELKLMMAQ